jgi:hypothetical protein
VVVALGAANDGGVNAAPRTPVSSTMGLHARSGPHLAATDGLSPALRDREAW